MEEQNAKEIISLPHTRAGSAQVQEDLPL